MSTSRAGLVFATGYLVGAVIVGIMAWFHDRDGMSGMVMLGLSLPTTIVYFLGLLAISRGQLLSPTLVSRALSGFLSAVFPTFCGYFPVYFMRLNFAVPLILGQFGLSVLISGIFPRLQKRKA